MSGLAAGPRPPAHPPTATKAAIIINLAPRIGNLPLFDPILGAVGALDNRD